MQARYYDPVVGRFYSNDPVGYTAKNPVMSFNRYLYVNNNPYKYNDPNGEFLNFIVGAVVGAALDVAVQYATTGEVDFGEVAVAAAAGAAGLGVVKNISKVSKLLNKGLKPKPGSKGGPGAGKNFSEKTKDAARQESGDKCVFCGKKTIRSKKSHPDRSNIDHSISKKNGGNNTLDNAQNTCQTCNLEKGAKDTAEYLKSKSN